MREYFMCPELIETETRPIHCRRPMAPPPFRRHRARPLHPGHVQSRQNPRPPSRNRRCSRPRRDLGLRGQEPQPDVPLQKPCPAPRRKEQDAQGTAAERQAVFNQVVEDATLLAQYAASQGEAYDVESGFPPEALTPQFGFSLSEIARRAARNRRLARHPKALPAAKHGFRRAAPVDFHRPLQPIFDNLEQTVKKVGEAHPTPTPNP
ncbi:hypothetical protein SBA3_690009 [Candidatus Sulfopaludibacter sp. SbA3]|nr:hypothetical protein SBA3_690009 [Candidatus Sulfopaludibacter sp. SbA3]